MRRSRAVVLVLALAGCASSGTTATTAPASTSTASPGPTNTTVAERVIEVTEPSLAASPEGFSATLQRYREDVVSHTVQIEVTNRSDQRVLLSALRLSWAGLVDAGPGPRTERLTPGQTLDLPVPVGDAVCSDPPRLDEPRPAGAAVALATATADDGTARQLRIPVTDTRGVLAGVHGPDCRRQSVRYIATLSVDGVWTDTVDAPGRAALAGTVRLHRNHTTTPVAITAFNGSVLFAIGPVVRPPSGPLLTLAGDATDAALPVVLGTTTRCDGHAIAESKQAYLWPIELAVGAGTTVVVDLVPDESVRPQLIAMLRKACGVG